MITLLISYIKKSVKKRRIEEKKEEGYGNEWDYY